MNTKNNILYLQIIDLVISVKFKHSIWKKRSFSLKKSIHKYFKYLILTKIPTTIDIEIEFTDNYTVEIVTNKPVSNVFINFYKELNQQKIITYYHISIYQFVIIVDRIIRRRLSESNGVIIHASTIIYKNKAIIFAGPSGVGKSTILNLLRKQYQAYGDDIVFIKKEKGIFYAHQTPLIEKKGNIIMKTTKKYPLKIIYFLKKSKYFLVKEIVDTDVIFKKLMANFAQENKQSINYNTKFLLNLMNLAKNYTVFKNLSFNLDVEKLLKEITRD